jgi:tetratricopeptide (TPR) repeat protein
MNRLLLAVFLSTLVVGMGGGTLVRVAHADDPTERAAKRHYERGQKLFNLQKFDEALEQFQKAYDAKPIPDFLFNIGQCHRNLGDYASAIFSFKKFLKLDPEAPNRDQVEKLIEELEQKEAEGNSERLGLGSRKPRVVETGETGDRPIYKKWWFWTGMAVVSVGAGVGIYAVTKGDGTPDTTFGNTVFPK